MATQVQNLPTPMPPTESAPTPRDLWLAERRKFIGGSEVFELLNEKQYGKGCARALGFRKLNQEPDFPEMVDDALLERGNILEPVAAAMYEQETGRKLRRPPMDENGLPKIRVSKEYPWAGVHADRLVLAGYGDVTITGTAEIKSRGEGPYMRILRDGLFPGDILQIQHGMFVNVHSWGPFITIGLFGGMPLKHFDVPRDESMIDIIKRKGDEFAETVFTKGELPAPLEDSQDQRCKVCAYRATCRGEEIDRIEAAAVKAEKAGKTPLVQIDNAQLTRTLWDIDIIKAEVKERKELLEALQEEAMKAMGDVPAALVHGYGKVYRMDSQANYIDATRIKAEKPEIYQQYFISRKTGEHFLRTYPTKQ
jgi:predicted phage-related endonuclease